MEEPISLADNELYYFAYASNLWFDQMYDRCKNSKYCGLGEIINYRWFITSRGYASIIESDKDVVFGSIFRISKSDEKALDVCEGVSSNKYYKKFINVDFDGSKISCLTYIDNETKVGNPKDEYIVRMNKGIIDAKLPEIYVEKTIRKFIPEN
ncbi:MAG: AIG2 family protein [uncultured bacterium]|nr:MAG: AIG2 family protein [uncultured bacterium]